MDATSVTESGVVGADVTFVVKDLARASMQIEKDLLIEESGIAIEREQAHHIASTCFSAAPDAVDRILSGEWDGRRVTLSFPEEKADAVEEARGKRSQLGEAMDVDMSGLMGMFAQRAGPREPEETTVRDALNRLVAVEVDKRLRRTDVKERARKRAEEGGIVFIDEVDKLCDVQDSNRTGRQRVEVQRELLGLVEGTTVQTGLGQVSTEHVLFICAGAFHQSKPTDLMPELQGRLPIRVSLAGLEEADLRRVLVEPTFCLADQTVELLRTEGLDVTISSCGADAIAKVASQMNVDENIGARRLRTVIARVTEKLSFDAPRLVREGQHVQVVDGEMVMSQVGPLLAHKDLSRYVL